MDAMMNFWNQTIKIRIDATGVNDDGLMELCAIVDDIIGNAMNEIERELSPYKVEVTTD